LVCTNLGGPGPGLILRPEPTKVLFGDQEALFDVDGETLVVQVLDGAGTVETIEGVDGQSDIVNFTIM